MLKNYTDCILNLKNKKKNELSDDDKANHKKLKKFEL